MGWSLGLACRSADGSAGLLTLGGVSPSKVMQPEAEGTLPGSPKMPQISAQQLSISSY